MANLTIAESVAAYEDVGATSNPTKLPVNWRFNITNLPVDNPSTLSFTIPGGNSFVAIDGSRPTGIDGSTAFTLSANPVDPSRYRLTAVSGSPPNFRVDRLISVSGIALSLVVQRSLALLVTAQSGSPFTGTQVGDIVLLPGPSTGDPATLFSPLNEGYWSVLGVTADTLTLARLPQQIFSGATETVTPVSDSQFRVFSADGVQVEDTVDISAGFALPARQAFGVAAVAPEWVEFLSTTPLAAQTSVIPGATGVLFYVAAKRWTRFEVDQECVLRLNGDTGNTNRIEAVVPADQNFRGWHEKWGPVWKAEIVNRYVVPMRVLILAAE